MIGESALRRNSILFWLVMLIALAIIAVGLRYFADPLAASAGFGIPADGSPTFAFQYAKGTRDIVSGLLLITLMLMKASRRVIGGFVAVAALIPLGDAMNVYSNAVGSNPRAVILHTAAALYMLAVATLLHRHSRMFWVANS